jgi:hypothetical protein
MVDDEHAPRATFLKRWSARKRAVAAEANPSVPPTTIATPAVSSEAALPSAPLSAPPATTAAALPPVESLTFHSDFAAFMRPEVDETLRRSALKKLFNDPRFNVMDGLDTYIDDYSKADPIATDVVRTLVQARYIFDPPQTRINEQGFVEDVPPPVPETPPPQDVDAIALASGEDVAPVQLIAVDPTETPVQAELPLADPAATDPDHAK